MCCNTQYYYIAKIRVYLSWFHRDEQLDGESIREGDKNCIR